MAIDMRSLLAVVVAIFVVDLVIKIVRAPLLAFDSDLRRIPGPWHARFTNIVLKYHVLTANRDSYIDALHQTYGPYVRITPQEISTSDIDSYRLIHRIGSPFTKAPWYQQLTPKQTNDNNCAVFAIRDPSKASARRRIFPQVITPSTIAQWSPSIRGTIDAAIAKIQEDLDENGVSDVMKWFQFMATDVLGTITFGHSFDCVKSGQSAALVRDIEASVALVGTKLELPWIYHLLRFMPFKPVREMFDVFTRFSDTYGRDAVENAKLAAKNPHGLPTIFSRMIAPANTTEPSEQVLPDSILAEEAYNTMIAGVDTASTALTYLVYCILSDRATTHALHSALSALPSDPSTTDLKNCAYLNAVISETLRLYSPVGGSLTRSTPPSGYQLGPYHVPGETLVGANIRTLHRDPRVFTEPLVFKPERWLNPTTEMEEHLVPWGGSARLCLGRDVARLELQYTTYKFFTTLFKEKGGGVELAQTANDKTMKPVEFFVIKPRSGKCEVVYKRQGNSIYTNNRHGIM